MLFCKLFLSLTTKASTLASPSLLLLHAAYNSPALRAPIATNCPTNPPSAHAPASTHVLTTPTSTHTPSTPTVPALSGRQS